MQQIFTSLHVPVPSAAHLPAANNLSPWWMEIHMYGGRDMTLHLIFGRTHINVDLEVNVHFLLLLNYEMNYVRRLHVLFKELSTGISLQYRLLILG